MALVPLGMMAVSDVLQTEVIDLVGERHSREGAQPIGLSALRASSCVVPVGMIPPGTRVTCNVQTAVAASSSWRPRVTVTSQRTFLTIP